jgi:hypothetical protein
MLKNFNLVNTEGLKGLFHKGRLIPFDKIDDTMAEQLIGKTHVLERVETSVPGPQAQLPATTEPAAAEAEAPAAGRKRPAGN